MTVGVAAAIVLAAIALVVAVLVSRRGSGDSMLVMQQQINSLRQQLAETMQASAQLLNQQLADMNRNMVQQLQSVNDQMFSSQQHVGQRLDAAARVVGEVQNSLGQLSQATERVFSVGKDIASLQEILRAPKLRGVIGELFLADLLQQMLPAAYVSLQHKFKSGETVDAALKLGSGLVSVDAKFPLENFRRILECATDDERRQARRKFISDVKKHIDAVAAKYIVPDEGTFDFALMYIPAENVYYEIIIKDEQEESAGLSAYALQRKVIPVSPNSFYAYLQAIVLGLKGLRVEKNVKAILEHLGRLHSDMQRFSEDFEVLGRHVTNLKNKYDDADRRLHAFGEKLTMVSHLESTPEQIERHET